RVRQSRRVRRDVGMSGLFRARLQTCAAVLNGRSGDLGKRRVGSQRVSLSFSKPRRTRSWCVLRAENPSRLAWESYFVGLDSRETAGGRVQRGRVGWVHGAAENFVARTGWRTRNAYRSGGAFAPGEGLGRPTERRFV